MEGITLTDIIWDANCFVLDLTNEKRVSIEDNEFSDKPSRQSKSLVDIKMYKKLSEIKDKISNCNHWDKWSKLINPYDKVPNLAKNKNSRDYYKFYEIIKYYNLTQDLPNNCSSGHLGESSIPCAKALTYFLPKLNWYAEKITSEIPHTRSFTDFSQLENENVKDENGYSRIISSNKELTFLENLKNFKDSVGKVHFFSADVLIDTSHDPNNQEQLIFHAIFAQIVYALSMQELGGVFIIKIFDCLTRPSCQLIYYLTNFYESVGIIKPRTSRYSNSEKYIVAKKFKGIDSEELIKLEDILTNWKDDLYCRVLGIELPLDIETQFFNYNNKLIENQYNYIEKIIKCSYNEEEIPEKQLEAIQNRKALDFCSNFGILVNLVDQEIASICKHLKKKKISVSYLKNVMICEKCLCLLIVKV